MTAALPPDRIAEVQDRLLSWFVANQRDLPWRRTRDPYAILVSEVMLQQTQVDRVIPYFERWLEYFPTVHALAASPVANVIQAWAGLGYNRRAVNLQRTAQFVSTELDGVFPSDVAALQRLPGIGPYTAGAIACFAFEQDVAFIDTNIRRVIHRLFLGPDLPEPKASDKELAAIAAGIVPSGRGWSWGQGIMEFGALQCTARKPACIVCPLQSTCTAWPAIQNAISERPDPAARQRKPDVPFTSSNRYFRGRVLDALRSVLGNEGVALAELGARLRDPFTPEDLPWIEGVVRGLERDGLARVAEDRPEYEADPGSRRVTLP